VDETLSTWHDRYSGDGEKNERITSETVGGAGLVPVHTKMYLYCSELASSAPPDADRFISQKFLTRKSRGGHDQAKRREDENT
jgi:hypothetical protein